MHVFNTFNITTEHFLCPVHIVKLSTTVAVYKVLHIQRPYLLVWWLQDTMTTTSLAKKKHLSGERLEISVKFFLTLLGTGSFKLNTFMESHSQLKHDTTHKQ